MNEANEHHSGLFFKFGAVDPQHIEGPPNIEAKRMIIFVGAGLSCSCNRMILKNELPFLIRFRLLADYLQSLINS